MDRNHIPVMPILGGKKHVSNKHVSNKHTKPSNADPDVNTIINQQKNDEFNVLNMDYEPTDEEKGLKSAKSVKKENDESSDSSDKKVIGYSWLVLSLAVIVIVLIIFIVWWVLGENKETNNLALTPGIIRPRNVNPSLYRKPVFKAQSELMPIQTQNMPEPKIQETNTTQPSKKELETVLSQMNIEPIPEESPIKKLKPKKVVPVDVTAEELMDNNLVSSFNDKLQSDIDNDNDNDDNADNADNADDIDDNADE